MNLAVILARGGSKRIQKKNIKEFLGKPVISYAIKTAKKSKLFNNIIVSTDSKEIANVAKDSGAEVPFMRPDNLSDDFTTTDEALLHVINYFENQSIFFNYVCCIYPVTPLLEAMDLQNSLDLLIKEEAISCFPVAEYSSSIYRALEITKEDRVKILNEEFLTMRSQDLNKAYYDLGQFYWVNKDRYLEEKRVWSSDCVPYLVDKYKMIDVDTLEDWKHVEQIYNFRNPDEQK